MSALLKADEQESISTPALKKAIEFCSTQTELARRMTLIEQARGAKGTIRTGHIYHWLRHGVPAERCPGIEDATDRRVTRYQLRPDVFGEAPPVPVQEAG